jgi:hypothetical protein
MRFNSLGVNKGQGGGGGKVEGVRVILNLFIKIRKAASHVCIHFILMLFPSKGPVCPDPRVLPYIPL